MDPTAFYDKLRSSLFSRGLKQSQVDALNAILAEGTKRGLHLESVAYVMATAYWEPGSDMVPVEEGLWYTSASRIRAVWPSRFPTIASAQPYVQNPSGLAMKVYGNRSDIGNLTPEDGWHYRGRGLVQLTGRANYQKAELKTGLPLVSQPDLMLKLDVSVRVLVEGMEEGWFTGYTLSAAKDVPGYEDDRKIVNGTNEARRIAGFAQDFEKALRAGGYDPTSQPNNDLQDWISQAPADVGAIRDWLARMPA